MRTLELTDEQKKTLKLFAYYCGSYGASTAALSVYLGEGGHVDWIDRTWYSETHTEIEIYDKIEELINYILEETSLLDYYDYDGNGYIRFELDVKEKKLTINGWHQEYSTYDTTTEWEIEEEYEEFTELFDELSGQRGRLDFNGSGDSGYIEDDIYTEDGNFKCPSFFEDWCYDKLGKNYGGWEINEGSQGSFFIFPQTRTIILEFQQNIEDEISDGVVGYIEF